MSTQEGILKFDLSDPDASAAFRDALNGENYRSVIYDLDVKLRSDYKYGTDGKTIEYAEQMRTFLRELLYSRGLTIE